MTLCAPAPQTERAVCIMCFLYQSVLSNLVWYCQWKYLEGDLSFVIADVIQGTIFLVLPLLSQISTVRKRKQGRHLSSHWLTRRRRSLHRRDGLLGQYGGPRWSASRRPTLGPCLVGFDCICKEARCCIEYSSRNRLIAFMLQILVIWHQ